MNDPAQNIKLRHALPLPGQSLKLEPSAKKVQPGQGPGSPIGRAADTDQQEEIEASEEPALRGTDEFFSSPVGVVVVQPQLPPARQPYTWAYQGPKGGFLEDDAMTNLSKPPRRAYGEQVG